MGSTTYESTRCIPHFRRVDSLRKWDMRYLDRLREQLAIAVKRGDRAAEIMLRARILRLTQPWTEAELRAAWGDR
jgi:hypothetical protein